MPGTAKSWLKRMAEGDSSPLEALYNRYGPALYSAVLQIVGEAETAAEVLEDVFARLWEQAAQWDAEPGSLFGKLAVLARYHALDRLRGADFRNRRQEWGDVENPDAFGRSEDPGPGDKIPVGERAERVRSAFEALPEGQREALKAAVFEGETCSQLAARSGKSRSETADLCREALETLRAQWPWMET